MWATGSGPLAAVAMQLREQSVESRLFCRHRLGAPAVGNGRHGLRRDTCLERNGSMCVPFVLLRPLTSRKKNQELAELGR